MQLETMPKIQFDFGDIVVHILDNQMDEKMVIVGYKIFWSKGVIYLCSVIHSDNLREYNAYELRKVDHINGDQNPPIKLNINRK